MCYPTAVRARAVLRARAVADVLVGVPGLSARHKQQLAERFATVEAFLAATDTDILKIVGVPADTAAAVVERRRRPEAAPGR